MPNRNQRRLRRKLLAQRFTEKAAGILDEEGESSLGQLTNAIRQFEAQQRLYSALGAAQAHIIIIREMGRQSVIWRYEWISNFVREVSCSSIDLHYIRPALLCRIVAVINMVVYEIDISMQDCLAAIDVLGKPLRIVGGLFTDAAVVTNIKEVTLCWLTSMIVPSVVGRFTAAIKEELHAAVWHPRRMAALLESGGWDAVENLNGD